MTINKRQFMGVFSRLALILVLMVFAAQRSLGAVGFSVTPAVISNTYNGPVTFLVTGLTNKETVVVQKYLDANGNGIVDAGDRLWQQFNLTDGTNFSISGVTNFNVPGDLDTIGGQITAHLYPQADFSQVIVANYLFVLSSPAGHFTPITNSFSVTNFPFAQKFTGTVLSSGVPVPNAAVLLFPASGSSNGGPGNPAGGVVANNSGVYSLAEPAGTYSLVAVKQNFVGSLNGAASLALTNGTTFSTNLNLLPATTTISGQVTDASSHNGVPGLALAALIKNGYLGFATGDTNGNFSIGVTAGQWGVSLLSSGPAFHGYVNAQNKISVDTSNGSVAGVSIALTKATALIYGTVTDNSGHALPGEVAVGSYDNNNGLYQSDGYTDMNGNFVAGVVGGLGSNDPWAVDIDNASSFPTYIFSQPPLFQNGGTNINAGTAVPASFTALTATNYITGTVTFNGTNVIGAGVNAYATINGLNYNLNTVNTGTQGNYSVAVANGNWNVELYDCGCSASDSLNNILVNYQDPPADSVTINSNNGTANFIVPAGEPGQIYGYVTDKNNDPVSGVTVYANNGDGGSYSTTTDDTGYYSFNVSSGTWDISVDCDELTADGYECVSDAEVTSAGGGEEQDFVVSTAGQPPVVTTASLPFGLAGTPYSQQLTEQSGSFPYTWSLTPGSLPLPAGLGISASGIISGTPSNVPSGGVTSYFSVRVTDSQNNTADQPLSIIVYPTLMITTNALPHGTVGTPYNAQFVVSGGNPSASGYFLSYGGSFPPGVTLVDTVTSSNEVFFIQGTPTQAGSFSAQFAAFDQNQNQVGRFLAITVLAASLNITTTSLPNASVGIAYTNQLVGSGGTTPYTWTIANGSQPLPVPLQLSTNGLITGIPANAGTNSFIVRLTDQNSLTTTRSFTLISAKPTLGAGAKISLSQFQFLLSGVAGHNYTLQRSTNLLSTNWLTLFITNNPATNNFIVTDPNATNKQEFYRVLLGP